MENSSRVKQIEEMAKIAAKRDDTCMAASIANALYNAGYRKASDIAREIDDLRRYIILNEDISLICKEENGEQNREYFKGKLSAFKQIRGYIDVELKKKYTEDGK